MERFNRRQCKQRKQRRQRLRNAQILLTCCLVAAASGYVFLMPGQAAFTGSSLDNSSQNIISHEPARPVAPRGYVSVSAVRDPFAVPEEFLPATPVPVTPPPANNYSNGQSQVAQPPKMQEMPLTLIGIVSGGGQKVAIIRSDGGSRSYQPEEYIGPYQLIAVGESSVTLWGPRDKKVLTLER